MALEPAGRAAVVGVRVAVEPVAALPAGAVVRREERAGAVGESQPLELGHDLAYAVVHCADHGRHDLPVPRQMPEAVHVLRRRVHGVVRRVVRHVEEERLAGLRRGAEILDGLPRGRLGEVLAVVPHLPAVLPQVVRGVLPGPAAIHAPVEDVGVVVDAPGEEAVPVVEAVVLRAGARGQAEVPLAGHERPVAERLQRRRDGGHFPRQAGGGPVTGQDRPHARVAGVSPRQQARARRRADGRVGVPVGEARAAGRQAVQVRRPEVRRPHARQVAVALIVRQEHDEVRLAHRLSSPWPWRRPEGSPA